MTWQEAIRKLGSRTCFCGNMKQQGHSFCWYCWKKLPRDLQKRLYEEKGYERTVEECESFLVQKSA